MAKIARVVVPAIPHHVTQRGNRRQRTFFNDGDYSAYDDELVTVAPLIRIAGDWKSFLSNPIDRGATDSLRRHEHTGRPLGDENFVARMERKVGRKLRKKRPGPKTPRC